jgi:glycosyltransferase involved in cell wall biosynthesis
MRVLIVNSLLSGGGIDSHTLSLCQALCEQSHEVTLAAPDHARWIARARRIPGLHVEGVGEGRLYWPLVLARLVRRRRPQLIHAHHGRDYWLALAAAWLGRTGARVVVTRHLMTPLKTKTQAYLRGRVTTIAVSDAVARSLAALPGAERLNVRRVHCGIDTAAFAPSAERYAAVRSELELPPPAFVFAIVANVHPPEGKGHFYFAEAAATLAPRFADSYFLCIGSGERLDDLKARVTELGADARFRFIHFNDEPERWLPGIDVLVHPAVASEALGLVVLEALACGKPVIASRLDGIPETFIDGEHGLLVPPREAGALAEAMATLAGDRARAQAMGERGRAWVQQRFSLPRLAQETVAVYEEALSR